MFEQLKDPKPNVLCKEANIFRGLVGFICRKGSIDMEAVRCEPSVERDLLRVERETPYRPTQSSTL